MNCQIRKPNIIQPGHSQTNAGILPLSFMVNSCKASFAGQKMVKSSTFLGEKMCPGARKQNVSNFFSSGSFAVGKGRTWRIRFLVLATWISTTMDWFLKSLRCQRTNDWSTPISRKPNPICPKRKYQPQTEGICYLTNYCVTFTPPLKQNNVLHRKFDKNNPRVQVRPRTFQELAPRFCNEKACFLCFKTKQGSSLDHHDAQHVHIYVYMYNVYTEKSSIESIFFGAVAERAWSVVGQN